MEEPDGAAAKTKVIGAEPTEKSPN